MKTLALFAAICALAFAAGFAAGMVSQGAWGWCSNSAGHQHGCSIRLNAQGDEMQAFIAQGPFANNWN